MRFQGGPLDGLEISTRGAFDKIAVHTCGEMEYEDRKFRVLRTRPAWHLYEYNEEDLMEEEEHCRLTQWLEWKGEIKLEVVS